MGKVKEIIPIFLFITIVIVIVIVIIVVVIVVIVFLSPPSSFKLKYWEGFRDRNVYGINDMVLCWCCIGVELVLLLDWCCPCGVQVLRWCCTGNVLVLM